MDYAQFKVSWPSPTMAEIQLGTAGTDAGVQLTLSNHAWQSVPF